MFYDNNLPMIDEPEVLFEARGQIALVTMNAPKSLNALSLNMIRLIQPKLTAWASDDSVAAVVVQGSGEKAFCAGGDIRDMYNERGTNFSEIYFGAEYALNVGIHTFPKPYIALMDGITMGGGAGMSVHGSHRVLSERTTFAMPETGIGLFPDIGGTWFLSCCPGQVGMYLGLTGYRMKAADTLYAGLGDFYVESDHNAELIAALAEANPADQGAASAIIKSFSSDPGPAPLAEYRETIDRCFAGDSVEAILAALEAEGTEWSDKHLRMLATKSPTSLKLTFRQLRLGPNIESIADIMEMEYRMANRSYRGHDMFEGIRAVVIDKDGAPKWEPDTLTAVSDADIDEYFEPVPGEPDFKAAQLS